MTDIPVSPSAYTAHQKIIKELGLIRLELVGIEERYYALRDAFYNHTHVEEVENDRTSRENQEFHGGRDNPDD